MASSVAAESMEPPPKRQKLSPFSSSLSTPTTTSKTNEPQKDETTTMAPPPNQVPASFGIQGQRERSVGILHFVNEDNPGFEGILKQRFTDFMVNEIDLNGTVLHLTRVSPPKQIPAKGETSDSAQPHETAKSPSKDAKKHEEKDQTDDKKRSFNEPEISKAEAPPPFNISDADAALLEEYFGSSTRSAILILNTKIMSKPDAKAASYGSVLSEPITDRQLRTRIHQDMRRIFDSRFETSSDENGAIKISAAKQRKPNPRDNAFRGNAEDNARTAHQKGKLGWEQLGGEYLHFTLYKENKDTMEILNFISIKSKRKNKDFSFAGTKDRRAVTAQRVSVFRMTADQLAKFNKDLYGAKVGNFKHEKHDLQLGDLSGNEFVITLRDCRFGLSEDKHRQERLAEVKAIVGAAMENLATHGFINYYGLQRFGSYGVGTDIVGKKILQGDYEGAVDCILSYDQDVLEASLTPKEEQSPQQLLYPKDDMDRAWAIMKFKRTGSARPALNRLPRRFNAEFVLISHLSSQERSGDFLGALQKINRNLRLMYVHAYQSLAWNMAASERWARFGGEVIKGDLVLVDAKSDPSNTKAKEEELDQNGEIVVHPAADDVAISSDDMFQRARPLTAEEAASGKYTIFDIVLPTPGFDIEYPDNEIGDYYKEFMMSDAGGNLDPSNMRRSTKDFSLSGSYRKVIGGIGKDWSFEIKEYQEENEQMVVTDVEKMHNVDNTVTRTPPQRKGYAWHPPANVVTSATYTRATAESAARKAATETWKALPTMLDAEDDARAQAQATNGLSGVKPEISQITYKETYIETSTESGKSERTGHRETTFIPGTNGSEMPPPPPTKSLERPSPLTTPGADFPSAASTESAYSESSGGVTVPPSPVQTKNSAEELEDDGLSKIAVIVKFQLGSAQYATMALRELMKLGGVKQFQPEYNTRK